MPIKKEDQNNTDKQSSRFLRYIFVVFLVISLLVLYVWQRVQKDNLLSEIQELRIKKAELTREYFGLKVEVYELSSLKRIEKIATERLNMHYPKLGEEYFILQTDKDDKNE